VEAEDVRLQLSEDVVTDGLADEDRIVLAGSDLSIECRFNVSISQHNASRIRWDIVRHFDDKSRQVLYFFFYKLIRVTVVLPKLLRNYSCINGIYYAVNLGPKRKPGAIVRFFLFS